MKLFEHLSELRSRVLKSAWTLLLGSMVGLVFSKKIFALLQIPLLKVLPPSTSFIATTPFEAYVTYFKVSLIAGLIISCPVIFYQIWGFVSPGLHPQEKKWLLPFSFFSSIMFVGGGLFGYGVVFPTGFYYVNLVMEGTGIQLMPKMSDYLNLAITLLISFGLAFELPLFIYLLGRLGLVQYSQIKKYRRYVIVCLFIAAAILTPGPDVISQCLLAGPLWILYELGGLLLMLHGKRGSALSMGKNGTIL